MGRWFWAAQACVAWVILLLLDYQYGWGFDRWPDAAQRHHDAQLMIMLGAFAVLALEDSLGKILSEIRGWRKHSLEIETLRTQRELLIAKRDLVRAQAEAELEDLKDQAMANLHLLKPPTDLN